MERVAGIETGRFGRPDIDTVCHIAQLSEVSTGAITSRSTNSTNEVATTSRHQVRVPSQSTHASAGDGIRVGDLAEVCRGRDHSLSGGFFCGGNAIA